MAQNNNRADFQNESDLEDRKSLTDMNQSKEGAIQNNETREDCEESNKAGEPQNENQPKGAESQASYVGQENPYDGQEASRDGQEGRSDGEADSKEDRVCDQTDEICPQEDGDDQAKKSDPKQYSCSYNPPNYIPNFTVVTPYEAPVQKKKEKKQYAAKFVVLCVLLSAVIAVVVGLTLGFLVSGFLGDGYWSNIFRAPITVIKNDGGIKVNEIVGSTGYDHLTVEEVVEYAADSVVEITTSQVKNDFFWDNYVISGAGSGVIISDNGYIMTNHHVIDGATTVTVRLTSGKDYEAQIIGSDADSDIAVIKIAETNLKAAVLGKSSELKVGQKVVAIGNPLGSLGGTVTDGIISALDRQVVVEDYPMTLLQTNAAINPGNSGGGLFNMAGELIGIVNAKQSDTGIEGLGFAIPIDVAWQKASDLMKYGYVTGKLLLNFEIEEKTEKFIVRKGLATHLFPEGIYISSSKREELEQYDRIVSVNGITINSKSDFYNVLFDLEKGDELKLVVSRLNGSGFKTEFREHTVTMEVQVTEPNS